MSTQSNNVALLCASNNLGVVIQDHFLAQKDWPLHLSVFTRESSEAKFSKGLNVMSTDYSPESPERGFRGQDVVIMLLPQSPLLTTRPLSTQWQRQVSSIPSPPRKNQYIHVTSYTAAQNEILDVIKKLTGQESQVEDVTSEGVMPEALEALEDIKKGLNWGLGHQVQAILFSYDSHGHGIGDFRHLGIWNEILGLLKSTLERDLKGPLTGD
ncbi:hypothetical protein FANTH_731 [Fusarium anthophilum]|uniref:NAD(P)-binding domain-containing protein n=1 Tax=Fusarium anthophilum TaxID=48485 RepID=A0A8H4ZX59_9HYPO|nr:hypothetical protein FANTH_731 [Fusarium anthophilum]